MTTLLVSADPAIAEPIADAFERCGDDVMWCRGPSGSDAVCRAIRGGRCPLTAGVDVVVIDSWLTSDQLGCGLRSSRLVDYYEHLELPVVFLVGLHENLRTLHLGPRTVTVPRSADPIDIVAAARGAAMVGGPHDAHRSA
jgi:hypothetical protein